MTAGPPGLIPTPNKVVSSFLAGFPRVAEFIAGRREGRFGDEPSDNPNAQLLDRIACLLGDGKSCRRLGAETAH